MEQAKVPLLEVREVGESDFDVPIQLADDEEESSDLKPLPTPARRRWSKIWRITKWLLISILPTPMHPGRPSYRANLHPTSWLDALRGYAAFIVFIYHIFGLPPIAFFHYPFIRVFWDSGPGMVALFFVISGYVLSYRILKNIHNRDEGKLVDSLASSTFRRWFRLFPSCGVAILVTGVVVQLRWWIPQGAPLKNNLWEQMVDCFWDFSWLADPFADVHGWVGPGTINSKYVGQLWTIPLEFRGSIVVFLFLAASCRMSVRGRMIFLWALLCMCYYWVAVYIGEFLFGVFLAELSLLRHPERLGPRLLLPQQEQQEDLDTSDTSDGEKPLSLSRRRRISRWWLSLGAKVIYILCFTLGFFLMGQPLDGNHIPKGAPWPWELLRSAIPFYFGLAQYTFWLGIGAGLIVFSLDSYRALQIPLEWSFSQYLGKLSFGMYAMHDVVGASLYWPIVAPFCKQHIGTSYWAQIPGQIFTAFVVIWISDYFTRIDDQVVLFARWLERKFFTKRGV